MADDYLRHADEYQEAKRQPWRTYLEQPSALQLLGDLTDRSVLDLACGEGYYSRLLRRHGAGSVLGVDRCSDMVALAQAQEQRHPEGIVYRVGDASNLALDQQFDLIFAAYLFNYARTRSELEAHCRTISRLLRPGGRLVAINNDPSDPPSNFLTGLPYGFSKHLDGPLIEGAEIHYRFALEDGGVFELTNYFLSRALMQDVMEHCGLSDVRWHQPQLAPEGLKALGAEYWEAIVAAPPFCLIEARYQ